MKLNTVNVIEMSDSCVLQMASFEENDEGNFRAEKLFKELAKRNFANPEELDSYVEDGIYEDSNYKVLLVHSTK